MFAIGGVMTHSKLLNKIALRASDKEEIAKNVIKHPVLLSEIFDGLHADKADMKYGCLKVLRIVSVKEPSLLYPQMDFFITLLDCDNNFFKWGAIDIIANLTAVDSKNKFEKIFNRYFTPIPGPSLITAANIIKGGARIALAKPKLTEKITKELLKVEKAKYKTPECRNVALGHTINAFDQIVRQAKDKKTIIKFVRKQIKNTRRATREKAEKFLKKHKIANRNFSTCES